MLEKITNNWIWKIISLVIAFFLWLVVINVEDPVIQDTLNIEVEKLNVEEVTDNNNTGQRKAVDYLKGEVVKVTVEGKRSIIEELSEGDIYAYADMATMSITNAININVEADQTLDIISVEPSHMEVALEDIVLAQKTIVCQYEGIPAEQFIDLEPTISPNIIEVTGAESQVALIDKVIVPVKLDNATRNVELMAAPKVLDNSGNEITGLELSVDEVAVVVPIQKTKVIPVGIETTGSVPEGYKLTDNPVSDVTEVTVRGSEESVDAFHKLVIDNISISDEQVVVYNVNLEDYLDEGLSIYSNNKSAIVTVFMEEIQKKEIRISAADINLKNMPDGIQFSYVDEVMINLIFEGIGEDLETITLDSLSPFIRLTALEVGVHEVSLDYYYPSYKISDLSGENVIKILLEEIAEEEPPEEEPPVEEPEAEVEEEDDAEEETSTDINEDDIPVLDN